MTIGVIFGFLFPLHGSGFFPINFGLSLYYGLLAFSSIFLFIFIGFYKSNIPWVSLACIPLLVNFLIFDYNPKYKEIRHVFKGFVSYYNKETTQRTSDMSAIDLESFNKSFKWQGAAQFEVPLNDPLSFSNEDVFEKIFSKHIFQYILASKDYIELNNRLQWAETNFPKNIKCEITENE